MAKNNNATQYVNGLFITKKEGQYGEYLSIGISNEGLEAIKALEPSASGFRNIVASPTKADPTKFSAKPYVPKGNSSNSGGDELPW
jgi:hypothetical protein